MGLAGASVIATGDPTQSEDGTDITTTSTTFEAGSPVVGHAFMAPASGIVWVNIAAWVEVAKSGTGTRICYMGFEVRTGGTVGSGTVVLAADEERTVAIRCEGNAGDTNAVNAGSRYLLTGLTPGSIYNVRTMHKTGALTTNATHSLYVRRVSTEPYSN